MLLQGSSGKHSSSAYWTQAFLLPPQLNKCTTPIAVPAWRGPRTFTVSIMMCQSSGWHTTCTRLFTRWHMHCITCFCVKRRVIGTHSHQCSWLLRGQNTLLSAWLWSRATCRLTGSVSLCSGILSPCPLKPKNNTHSELQQVKKLFSPLSVVGLTTRGFLLDVRECCAWETFLYTVRLLDLNEFCVLCTSTEPN